MFFSNILRELNIILYNNIIYTVLIYFYYNMKISNKKKHYTRKIINGKTKNIKNIKFNKYENTKVNRKFKLIKMPYINTELLESKFILSPLKNIQTNKESIDTEQSLEDEFMNIEKIQTQKQNSKKHRQNLYIKWNIRF